jgi:hypothetical protein
MLADRMIADFADTQDGGFFFTASDHESLVARPKDPYDGALPGANSMAVLDLLALHRLTREERYLDEARKTLESFSTALAQNPAAMPVMLVGLLEYFDARQGQITPKPLGEGALAPVPNRIVTASARLKDEKPPSAGQSLRGVVSLAIKDGWHIYANPTGVDILKPTTLVLDADQPAGDLKVSYPAGAAKVLGSLGKEKVSLYEGKVEIPISLSLRRAIPTGKAKILFRLRFQACNDKVCLAPANLAIPLELNVGRPAASPEPKK